MAKKPDIKKTSRVIVVNRTGLSFFSALTIILILMKIIGYNIEWKWIIAAFLGPLIIAGIVVLGVLAFFIFCFIVSISIDLYDSHQSKKRLAKKIEDLNNRR